MRWSRTVIASAVFLIIYSQFFLAVIAYAHPDFRIVDGTVVVPQGGFTEFLLPVHFHRVVGTFQVTSPVGGLVEVVLMDDQAYVEYAAGKPTSRLYSSGEISQGTLNFLIPCCLRSGVDPPGQYNQELTYTKYHLVVENRNASPSATVRLRVDLLHDGPAVIMYYGEPFAVAQLGSLFVVVGAGLGLWLRKRAKGRTVTALVADKMIGRKVIMLSLASFGILIFAAISVIGLSALLDRTRAFGGAEAEAFMATDADLSLSLAILGGTVSLLAVIVPWIFAGYVWRMGFAVALRLGARLVGAIFVAQGIAIIVGFLLAFTYGPFPVPALVLSLVAVAEVPAGLYLIKESMRKTPAS